MEAGQIAGLSVCASALSVMAHIMMERIRALDVCVRSQSIENEPVKRSENGDFEMCLLTSAESNIPVVCPNSFRTSVKRKWERNRIKTHKGNLCQ